MGPSHFPGRHRVLLLLGLLALGLLGYHHKYVKYVVAEAFSVRLLPPQWYAADLADDSAWVRLAALKAIRRPPRKAEIASQLLDAAVTSPDWRVRRNALAMGAIYRSRCMSEEEFLRVLTGLAAGDPDRRVRDPARAMLQSMQDGPGRAP